MTYIDRRQLLRGTAALAAAAALTPIDSPAYAAAALGAAQPLDGRPFPAYDYTRANKLPREMTGYWTKSFDVGGVTRTAKVYISAETPIRAYYTVVAVPDRADTAEFLQSSGWRDVADRRQEGLFVLEPGPSGWADAEQEAAYVAAALGFYQSNNYFSIFGENYFVGYGNGAPALEAWAVANPLKVIAQAYVDSPGLNAAYLASYASREYDGQTQYSPVDFPAGFRLIRYDETVLPTWYIRPEKHRAGASVAYWKRSNDTVSACSYDDVLGTVYRQRPGSGRWMTSHAGPISKVAVQTHGAATRQIVEFLTAYTRYENSFAYGNQLYERADFRRLGIEVHTMQVEGFVREYLVYRPRSARRNAPVLFVWPGDSQTDKVFVDATQWWKVADREGILLVFVCEQYSRTSVVVSHRDSLAFYRQLRDVITARYDVDPTRFYSTGQSAGSGVTQNLAIAFPEYFAAVASSSFPTAPNAAGTVSLDGVAYPASGRKIPNYLIYGYGDIQGFVGTLWDDTQNQTDSWAQYHLGVDGLVLSDVDTIAGRRSGFHDRFQTWTWYDKGARVPILKLTRNVYRSHNTTAEEPPLLWDFLKHYSREIAPDGTVTRYYSPSAFDRPGDRRRI
ncbi:PHB depolymerase family esterase [Paractinoplanes globisporus]|uniref:PHB depolymerase family esterase n=1 Tax=Paractinoplanes globisporus TaxID=113565 RepID=A0ABW6WDE0_9ACTN|nr:PHB depolymerase family esterase [Actinoplanes globisporus]